MKYGSDDIVKLIKRVNSTIIGTANYWKQGVAKEAFSEIDYYVWTLTKRYLRKQHPKNLGNGLEINTSKKIIIIKVRINIYLLVQTTQRYNLLRWVGYILNMHV